MKRVVIVAALLAVGASSASAATLDTVKQRGTLVCGVSTGFAGFSAPDSQGNFKGLDVDYCRALAAGVLGDASKVRYVALTAQNRFTALQSGEIDVLYRNSTQTFLRGATLGLRQGPVNFYDGQGFVVKKDTGVKELKDLKGATVCVAQGTTHEVTLGDYGRANGIDWKPLVFDRPDTMLPDLLRRPLRCHDPGRFRARRLGRDRGAKSGRLSRAAASPSARSRSVRSPATATRSGATSSPGCTTALSKPRNSA